MTIERETLSSPSDSATGRALVSAAGEGKVEWWHRATSTTPATARGTSRDAEGKRASCAPGTWPCPPSPWPRQGRSRRSCSSPQWWAAAGKSRGRHRSGAAAAGARSRTPQGRACSGPATQAGRQFAPPPGPPTPPSAPPPC